MTHRLSVRFLVVFVACFLYLASFLPVQAAELTITASTEAISVGDQFEVSVSLFSVGVPINALEGTLAFPSDLLVLKSIRDGNSVITLWIENPSETRPGHITFSGVTPGGFSGSEGSVFSAVFEATQAGEGVMRLNNLNALLNDGAGTQQEVSARPWLFRTAPGTGTPHMLMFDDTTPPEPFVITLATGTDLFDGQPFIVFLTTDKGSGVHGYVVCEGLFGTCTEAQSPYRLSSSGWFVRVHAIDTEGNVRSETLFTPTDLVTTLWTGIVGILVGGLCLAFFWLWRHSLR